VRSERSCEKVSQVVSRTELKAEMTAPYDRLGEINGIVNVRVVVIISLSTAIGATDCIYPAKEGQNLGLRLLLEDG
jgi:hypothetical protein